MPHGQCWLWDVRLVVSTAVGNLLVFCAYTLIPIIGYYIYRQGELKKLRFTYPKLWTAGLEFIWLCGLTHLIQVTEIWIGGWVFYLDAITEILTGIVSLRFVILLWRLRDEIVIISRIINQSMDQGDNKP